LIFGIITFSKYNYSFKNPIGNSILLQFPSFVKKSSPKQAHFLLSSKNGQNEIAWEKFAHDQHFQKSHLKL